MKLKNLFVLIGISLSFFAYGQQNYTDVIQRSAEGEGTLVLHQSKTITDLVNGKSADAPSVAKKAVQTSVKKATVQVEDSIVDSTGVATPIGVKVKVNGYRIQVYSGGNTRKGKAEATMMGQRVKSLFSELPVYTHFISPHWICRVGDFRTYEEANEYFRLMKETGRFPEAVLVRSKVTVYN